MSNFNAKNHSIFEPIDSKGIWLPIEVLRRRDKVTYFAQKAIIYPVQSPNICSAATPAISKAISNDIDKPPWIRLP